MPQLHAGALGAPDRGYPATLHLAVPHQHSIATAGCPPAHPLPIAPPWSRPSSMAAFAVTAAPVAVARVQAPRRPAARPSPRSAFVARRPALRAVRVSADASTKAGKFAQRPCFRPGLPAPHHPRQSHRSRCPGWRGGNRGCTCRDGRRRRALRIAPHYHSRRCTAMQARAP